MDSVNKKTIILLLFIIVLIINRMFAQSNQEVLDVDFYLYPTPSEIFEVIDKGKLNLNKKLLNPAENESNYILAKSKYLNLGVYLTDLALCTFFEKKTKSMEYVKVISNLSNSLLISSDLKTHLSDDIFDNLENMDSIYKITSEHYYDIMRELSDNNSNNVMYIITTGAYVEAFYISLNMIEGYIENCKILNEVAEQKFALKNLMKFSKYYEGDSNVADVIKYQEELLEIFDTFLVEEGVKRTFKVNEKGKLVFSGGPKITMNKYQYEKLKETVKRIRTEIVN